MKFSLPTVLTVLAMANNVAITSAQSIVDIVVGSPDHTTLEAAVIAAPPAVLQLLSDPTADLTLFAPDDDAFGNLIGAVGEDYVNGLLTPEWGKHLFCVLASHVLQGAVPSSAITGPLSPTSLFGTVLSIDNMDGSITVDGNPVIGPDIMASNGVVHSITGLPILPSCVTQSIVDIASANENFSTLVSLVRAANLVNAVATTRPITVLAPTNEAFAKVPAEILNYLASDVAALTEVLLYHVLPGIQLFETPTKLGSFDTLLEGKQVKIEVDDDGMTEINDVSDVTGFDILASNGAIQVIDTVLLPPGFMIPAPAPSPVAAPTKMSEDSGKMGGMGMGMGGMSGSNTGGKKKSSGSKKRARRAGRGLRQQQ